MKQYFKSFLYYGVTLFFNAGISFVIFSLLTHHLTERDFGIVNIYSSFSVFLVPFISSGVQFPLSVNYYKMQPGEYRGHFASGIVVTMIMTGVITVILFALFPFVRDFLNTSTFFLLVLPVSCFLIVLNEIVLGMIRNKEKHKLYSFFSIGKNLVEIGMTFGFVILLSYNWQGRLMSAFLTLIVTGIFIFFLLRRWDLVSGPVTRKSVLAVYKEGLPFLPERLAIFFLAYSDRFFIDYYAGIEDVGLYASGAQIALIVNMLIITLNNTFFPLLLKNLSIQPVNNTLVRKISFYFIGATAIVTVLVLLATPLVFKYFIGVNFQGGSIYARLLTIGFFFWGINNVFLVFLLNKKKNKIIMGISLASTALSFLLNAIAVKYFGPIGATYTCITVYFFMAGLSFLYVCKFYDLRQIFLSKKVDHDEQTINENKL